MTLYEFLMQSPKQIQEIFRSKDWFDTYHKVPLDIPSWCKCFDLEPDERITGYHHFERDHEYWFAVKEEIPGSWLGFVAYDLCLSVSGRSHKIVVHFSGFTSYYSSSSSPTIGCDKYLPGHSEKEKDSLYYRLDFDIEQAMFSDGFKEHEISSCSSYKTYIYKDSISIKEYHDRFIEIYRDIDPYFKEVYDSFYSGEFRKLWKKYYGRDPKNDDMNSSGFGVGLRGLVCLMYFCKKKLDRKLSLEESIALSTASYGETRSFIAIKRGIKKSEKDIINSILFYTRDGFFDENLNSVRVEDIETILKKVKK